MRSINFDYFRKTKKQCSHIFCPCPAFEHEYQQFQWRQVSEKVSTTLPEMKAEYESNYNDKVTTEKLLMGCLHELKVTKAKLFCLLARVGSSCLLLEATALRSNTLSLADYLSLMRSRVAEELAPGYLTRLEILKELQQSLARRSSESNALEILANSPINRNQRKMSCQSGEWQSIETFANSFAIDGYWS
jgi:thymidylate synthase ThyX